MENVVKELSQGLAGLAKRGGPSVVRLEARRRGMSSGVVWSDGVIVSAGHAVEWDDGITVGLPDGGEAKANVTGRDPATDLVVLRSDATGLAVPAWSEPEDLDAGHLVLALSRPGQRVRASLGMVNVRGEEWWTPAGGRIDHDIRIEIGLHPGFSGSLLVEASGRALGINTTGLVRATPTLIPTATIRRVVGDLLAHGHVRKGYLGIGTQGVRLPADIAQALGQPSGLLITSVQPDSAAARGGVLLGDVLVGFAGQPLRHPAELLPLLDESRIGQTVVVKVLRAGRIEDVTVTVGARNGESGAKP
jgi:S1-C subfamily serine protease